MELLILSLEESPERVHYPSELSIQGIKEFKEIVFKPYRVIYEIIGSKVIVHLCVDGRRDMRTLLERSVDTVVRNHPHPTVSTDNVFFDGIELKKD